MCNCLVIDPREIWDYSKLQGLQCYFPKILAKIERFTKSEKYSYSSLHHIFESEKYSYSSLHHIFEFLSLRKLR